MMENDSYQKYSEMAADIKQCFSKKVLPTFCFCNDDIYFAKVQNISKMRKDLHCALQTNHNYCKIDHKIQRN